MDNREENKSSTEFFLENQFELKKRSTTIIQEFRAATATFLTMSYILLVNPQLLSNIGIPSRAVVVSTALSSFVGSLFAGFFGNLPLGLAPGIGLSAYLTYGIVLGEGQSVSSAFTSCFIAGILLLILCVTGLSSIVMKMIPRSVKLATIVGMGLQIALVGMTSVHLVVANKQTIVGLGNIESFDIWASILGLVLIGSLLFHQIRGGILIGIIILTIISWIYNNNYPQEYINIPNLNINITDFINFYNYNIIECIPAILSFLFIGVIDVSGVIFGMASLAGVTDKDGNIPGATPTFAAVSLSTLVSAITGGTPIIVYVESAAGIKEGGRTGLTAIFISLYFLLSLFFAPILSEIPVIATSPVSILVGAMMMSQAVEVDWNNMSEAIPAFLTLITMPLTFSITNGIVIGLITAFLFYITTGEIFYDIKVLLGYNTNDNMDNSQHGHTELTNLVRSESMMSKYSDKSGGSHAFLDDEPFVRAPSLILPKNDADAVRKARGMSMGSDDALLDTSNQKQLDGMYATTTAAKHTGDHCVSYL